MATILEKIHNTTSEQAKKLREDLRTWLIEFGEAKGDMHFVEWAKKLNDNGLDACCHFGFSESAFVETVLNAQIKIKDLEYTIELDNEPEVH